MKWSFLFGLLASASILSPLSASANAPSDVSATLIAKRYVARASHSSGRQNVKQQESKSDSKSLSSLTETGLVKKQEGKATPTSDQLLSRSLGSGGEGGGTPSASKPSGRDSAQQARPYGTATHNGVQVNDPSTMRGNTSSQGLGSSVSAHPTQIIDPSAGQSHPMKSSRSGHSPQFSENSPVAGGRSSSYAPAVEDSSPVSMGGGMSSGGSYESADGITLTPEEFAEYQRLQAEQNQQLNDTSEESSAIKTTINRADEEETLLQPQQNRQKENDRSQASKANTSAQNNTVPPAPPPLPLPGANKRGNGAPPPPPPLPNAKTANGAPPPPPPGSSAAKKHETQSPMRPVVAPTAPAAEVTRGTAETAATFLGINFGKLPQNYKEADKVITAKFRELVATEKRTLIANGEKDEDADKLAREKFSPQKKVLDSFLKQQDPTQPKVASKGESSSDDIFDAIKAGKKLAKAPDSQPGPSTTASTPIDQNSFAALAAARVRARQERMAAETPDKPKSPFGSVTVSSIPTPKGRALSPQEERVKTLEAQKRQLQDDINSLYQNSSKIDDIGIKQKDLEVVSAQLIEAKRALPMMASPTRAVAPRKLYDAESPQQAQKMQQKREALEQWKLQFPRLTFLQDLLDPTSALALPTTEFVISSKLNGRILEEQKELLSARLSRLTDDQLENVKVGLLGVENIKMRLNTLKSRESLEKNLILPKKAPKRIGGGSRQTDGDDD